MVSRYKFEHDNPWLRRLQKAIRPQRETVLAHPVYSRIRSINEAAWFMESHVFAVWDFMSLLKTLQASLTCVTVPWMPQGFPVSRRLINEIVLAEESDEFADGYQSHFELYLTAMSDAGADLAPVCTFMDKVRSGAAVTPALVEAGAPAAASAFVRSTWEVLMKEPLHCQAAAFAFGREDLIPEMFEHILGIEDPSGRLARFRLYLERHIEVDADSHSPLAMQVLIELCGDDNANWDQCAATIGSVLAARVALWDGICAGLRR
jgi:hypothetical protein